MTLALQIGIGVWLGGLFLIGSVWGFVFVADSIKANQRYGRSWWKVA